MAAHPGCPFHKLHIMPPLTPTQLKPLYRVYGPTHGLSGHLLTFSPIARGMCAFRQAAATTLIRQGLAQRLYASAVYFTQCTSRQHSYSTQTGFRA
jgi:hypothetical protein